MRTCICVKKLLIMINLSKLFAITFTLVAVITLLSSFERKPAEKPAQHKIQVAILLDVSGSMDGLIDQAKAQLWNMVTTMGKAKCGDNLAPKIEIALYEYGRTTNNAKLGYVKQINGFLSDLDSLSQNLFSLKTNGGDEYCGHVIYSSLNELKWDAAADNYKVIFIAGNEDFLQGDVVYTKACALAKDKGVIVNTIYCGDRMAGIKEHWNLAGECGNGSFTNINQNAKAEDIPTPYDDALFSLNNKLNETYISYGNTGALKKGKQVQMDKANTAMSKSAGLQRVVVKNNAGVYKNAEWDLVDAKNENKNMLVTLDKKSLPDSLQRKSTQELEKFVLQKSSERTIIQKEIAKTIVQRNDFITAEKLKTKTTNPAEPTLETAIEKIIKTQAMRFNMKIE